MAPPTLFLALWSIPTALAVIDISSFSPADTITKDVVIIGGGASGAHAAYRLKEDYNKTVVVVEKDTLLVRAPCLLRSCYKLVILTSRRVAMSIHITIHRLA
jgi:hypothetical protein